MSAKMFFLGFSGFLSGVLTLLVVCAVPAFSEEQRARVDWSKLNLSMPQTKQVEQLEERWQTRYSQLKAELVEDQKKIANLLGSHGSDPVEIMTLQSSIAQKREQLSACAMETYLKKREVLNDNQQRALEIMVRQAIAAHEKSLPTGVLTETVPDRIQGLMLRARNVWNEHE